MDFSFVIYQTQKLRPQRISVKTTQMSDRLWSPIFSIIVYSGLLVQVLFGVIHPTTPVIFGLVADYSEGDFLSEFRSQSQSNAILQSTQHQLCLIRMKLYFRNFQIRVLSKAKYDFTKNFLNKPIQRNSLDRVTTCLIFPELQINYRRYSIAFASDERITLWLKTAFKNSSESNWLRLEIFLIAL